MTKKIIKFETSTCTPCKLVSNFLDMQKVEYERIDAIENPEKANEYEVMSVPVTILLDGGKEIYRVKGFDPNGLNKLIQMSK